MPELEDIFDAGDIERSGDLLRIKAFTGDVTKAAAGTALTIANDAVTDAKLRDSAALSVIGNATNATASPADIAAASDHQVLRRSGTAIAFGAVNLAQSAAVTGDLPFANLAQGAALSVLGVTGNATADVASIAAGTDGHVLKRVSSTSLAFSNIGVPQLTRKTAAETVNSSTTLQADDHLLFAIGANETWEFDFVINFTSNETADFKFCVSGPTACAGQWTALCPQAGSVSGNRDFLGLAETTWDSSVTFSVGAISTLRTGFLVKGLARNGANAGNITLNWAQNTSTAVDTIVAADSYVKYVRIA